ncbi:hypothetical protein LSH36_258g02034 [Paralvinella palmiformis]|uniref:Uncharacterized protein n=1 Tax=Paralvinella palmiformis TaxID=53620 RepID=A0AAD9JKP3_9ANNE|nr:hypothetical protein LSH36_258g02034 [Paralvinella palmiformis]
MVWYEPHASYLQLIDLLVGIPRRRGEEQSNQLFKHIRCYHSHTIVDNSMTKEFSMSAFQGRRLAKETCMEKIGPDPFWILGILALWVIVGKAVQGTLCNDGDVYGYTNGQEPSITEENDDTYYLSGTVWYSNNYGRFDCCGVIKAIDLKVNMGSYIEFQVWKMSNPVSTKATFKAMYRAFVEFKNGEQQTLTIPLDKQMPVRDGDAFGWISELSDAVKWTTDMTLSPSPDSDYLWEEFSSWGYYNATYTFAYHPKSFSTLDNEHNFANNGGENRVYGIRATVHPGHTASFDELPLSIAIYTTSHVVGDVVHTVLFSGVPALERSTYVTLEAKISPDDGHLKWDSTTNQLKVADDLITAVFDSPYTVTITMSDGCHDDQVGDLSVYVFDDRPQTPVCTSGQQIVLPPSALWDQNQEETIQTGVAITDPRWRIPFKGMIEAVEVCVSSSPAKIEIQLWKISDLSNGELIMLDYYVFTVTDTGCPASKVMFPVQDQMPVSADLVIGWREAEDNAGIFMYSESKYLPATDKFQWTDLSGGIPYDYDTTGNPFSFEDAESGNADVLVNVATLDGLQGNTYELSVQVTDGCTITKQNLTIYLYIETTTTTTTEPTTTTTAEPTTTTAEPTTTTIKEKTTATKQVSGATDVTDDTNLTLSQITRSPEESTGLSTTDWAVIGVCIGLGLAVIGTISCLGVMCHKYFGAKNMVQNLSKNRGNFLNNQMKRPENNERFSKRNNLRRNSFTPPNSPSPTPRTITPRNINLAWHY